MPGLVSMFGERNAAHLGLRIHRLEQTELYFGGVLREQRKIHPSSIPRGAGRVGTSWPNAHRLTSIERTCGSISHHLCPATVEPRELNPVLSRADPGWRCRSPWALHQGTEPVGPVRHGLRFE